MAEQKVPEKDQVIYVNPSVMTLIRQTTELKNFLTQGDFKGDVNYTLEKYMGRPIIEVPSDEFYTDCNLLQNATLTGLPTNKGAIAPTTASKTINFLVVDKNAPIVVKKLDWAKVYDSDQQNLGYAGYLLNNLYYHDIFVEDNKKVAIYCSVSTSNAIASGLLVSLVAGNTTNYTICDAVLTQPAGIIYDKIFVGTSAFTLGADEPSSDTGRIYIGTEFDKHGNDTYYAVAYGGKIVATSKKVASANLPIK